MRRELCPSCHNPLSETTDFDLRDQWQVEPVTCFACKAKEQDIERRESTHATLAGVTFEVHRKRG